MRGAVSAIHRAIQQIGWSWPAPFTFVTESGVALHQTQHSPCMIRKFALKSYSKVLAGAYSKSRGYLNDCEVTNYLLRRVLKATAYTEVERAMIRTWAVGGFWTPARKQEAGLQEDSACPLCSEPVCDVAHIFGECTGTSHLRCSENFRKLKDYVVALPEYQQLQFMDGVMRHPETMVTPMEVKDEVVGHHSLAAENTWMYWHRDNLALCDGGLSGIIFYGWQLLFHWHGFSSSCRLVG